MRKKGRKDGLPMRRGGVRGRRGKKMSLARNRWRWRDLSWRREKEEGEG